MKHSVTIVFGEQAAQHHENGASDEEVLDLGSIETFGFETEAELKAFMLGLESMEGWMGYTIYDPA